MFGAVKNYLRPQDFIVYLTLFHVKKMLKRTLAFLKIVITGLWSLHKTQNAGMKTFHAV